MKLLNLLSITFALSGISSAIPATPEKALEPITGTVVGKGVTEQGEPYTITADFVDISDKDLALFKNNPGNSTTSLEKRGFGSKLNCDQWFENKYCYCGGAISNRGDCYWGSQEFCNMHKFKNFRNTSLYHVKWLPTVKIEYWVTNKCNHDRYVGDNCGGIFLDLIDWCEWSWMTAKGGHQNFDDCLFFRFDVNGR